MNSLNFSVADAPLQVFYIQSMLFNTTSALQSYEKASRCIQAVSEGRIDLNERKNEFLDCLQNIINHAGAISRYFFPSRESPKKEKPGHKNMHKNRGEYLCKVFDVTDASPLKSRKLRNFIEHFDERLDIYLTDGVIGYIFPSLILNEPQKTDVPHHIFRAYYLKERIFQVLGDRYEIQSVVDELERIHGLLVQFDENGGILKLTE